MDERDWQLLHVLFEQKNITRAAAILHMTQPALSTRVRNIEERFNTRIVLRGKRGVVFTPAGEFLAHKAEAMLNEMQDIGDAMDSMRESPSGVLRIAAPPFFTQSLLPGLLRDFKQAHPGVEFRVRTGWSQDMGNLVQSNAVHLAFARGDRPWHEKRYLLFNEHMYVVCNRQFSLDDIAVMPLIHYQGESANQALIDRWWADRSTLPPTVGMTVDRVDTCKEMVRAGLGYGFLPATILQGESELFVQKMRFTSGEPLNRPTWIILKNTSAELRLIKAFIRMVREKDFDALLRLPQDI